MSKLSIQRECNELSMFYDSVLCCTARLFDHARIPSMKYLQNYEFYILHRLTNMNDPECSYSTVIECFTTSRDVIYIEDHCESVQGFVLNNLLWATALE